MADQPTFESAEEVQAYYGRLLSGEADEAKKVKLELEQARAEASVYRGQQQRLQRAAWTTKALAEFPNATAEDLRGDTEDDILASAKTMHERIEAAKQAALEARQQELEEQTGRRAYGRPTAVGGGVPVQDPNSPDAIIQKAKTSWETRGMSGAPESPKKILDAHMTKIIEEKVGA